MLTSGFYNSLDNDREYWTEDISRLFDGLIADGVFATIGEGLIVESSSGMQIKVRSGRAWFNHTWTYNDTDLLLNVPASDLVLDRIDVVVLEVNSTLAIRQNSIKILQGSPDATPTAPSLTKSELVNQYPLAEIYVAGGVGAIDQSNITNKVGTAECPFVSGVIDTIDADALLLQWDQAYTNWQNGVDAEVNAWFDAINVWKNQEQTDFTNWRTAQENDWNAWYADIQDVFDEQTITNLYSLIAGLRDDVDDIGLNKGDITADPNTTIYPTIMTKHANCPNSAYYWHIRTQFYSSISASSNRAQIAIGYNVEGAYVRKATGTTWTDWRRIDNQPLSATDIRDVLKTVDGSGSGIDADMVDGWHRDSIRAWANILDKPAFSNMKVASGSFSVDSVGPRDITVGFKPLFLIIKNDMDYSDRKFGIAMEQGGMAAGQPDNVFEWNSNDPDATLFTATGFTLLDRYPFNWTANGGSVTRWIAVAEL